MIYRTSSLHLSACKKLNNVQLGVINSTQDGLHNSSCKALPNAKMAHFKFNKLFKDRLKIKFSTLMRVHKQNTRC